MIWQDTAADVSMEAFDDKDRSMSSFATTVSSCVWSSSANQNNIAQNVSSSSSMSNRMITDNTTIKAKPTAAKENMPLTKTDTFGRASSQAENQLLPSHTSSSSSSSTTVPVLGSGSVRFTSSTVSPPRTSNTAPTTSKTGTSSSSSSTPPGSSAAPSRPRKSLAEATSMLFGDFDLGDTGESYNMVCTPPPRSQNSILSSSAWLNSVYTAENTPEPANGNGNGKGGEKGSDGVAASLLQKLMKETRESAAAAQRGGSSQNRIIDLISTPSYTTFSAPTYAPMPGDKEELPRPSGEPSSCALQASYVDVCVRASLSLSLYRSLGVYLSLSLSPPPPPLHVCMYLYISSCILCMCV